MHDELHSSQSDTSAMGAKSTPVPSLEVGLTALKQKDYETAITHLQGVSETSTDIAMVLKAQMGLATTYEQIGDIDGAIALCQPLSQSTSRQVREWAAVMLEKLYGQRTRLSHSPSDTAADETGFVPITQMPSFFQEENTVLQDDESHRDPQTGFVPLTDRSSSGFTKRPSSSPTPASVSRIPSASHLQPDASSASSPPTQPASDPLSPADSVIQNINWRRAGRAQKWGSLGRVDSSKLWALMAGTAIALLLFIRSLLQAGIGSWNEILSRITSPLNLPNLTIYHVPPDWLIILGLIGVLLASPGLMDQLLLRVYGAQTLDFDTLVLTQPEAGRVLKRICNQRQLPIPALRLLPEEAPLALTYGFYPANARIAISQGLLTHLADDEITTILAAEVSHILQWDFVLLSLITLVAQVPFLVYWLVASWGDRCTNPVLRFLAIGISAAGYGLFWCIHWIGLWLSRVRMYYSDRSATEMTGNPNALTRALLKSTIATAQRIQHQGHTLPLLESFDLLTPIGHQSALTLGSACSYAPLEWLLEWDRANPYRHWLAINNAHSPLGDRLNLLTLYARHWRLDTELEFPPLSKTDRNSTSRRQGHRFWLQIAPFAGLVMGLAIAALLWSTGAIADRLRMSALSWLWGDQSILWGCLLTGFSIGTVLRINPFFPDITRSNLQANPSLVNLLTPLSSLPIDSQPIRLQGTLLGRRGMSNFLGQDLFLQSGSGLIKLHYQSQLGALGKLMLQVRSPSQILNQSVTVTGWFRRGATPWIDLDVIQPERGSKIQSSHPIWSTVLAILAALISAYIVLKAG